MATISVIHAEFQPPCLEHAVGNLCTDSQWRARERLCSYVENVLAISSALRRRIGCARSRTDSTSTLQGMVLYGEYYMLLFGERLFRCGMRVRLESRSRLWKYLLCLLLRLDLEP